MLISERNRIILWTVREGKYLEDAVAWCRERGIEFYAINKDYPEEKMENNKHFSRKIKADMFIDDRNVGGLPEWGEIYRMIHEKKSYEDIIAERHNTSFSEKSSKRKKHWWNL